MAVYATVDDLQAYLGKEPPAGAQKMLSDASARIDSALISSSWTVDSVTGLPTDVVVIAGFKLATCQQVEYWILNGTDADGASGWSSFSIEGISVSRDPEQAQQRRSRLCDAAYETLRLITVGTAYSASLLPGKPTI